MENKSRRNRRQIDPSSRRKFDCSTIQRQAAAAALGTCRPIYVIKENELRTRERLPGTGRGKTLMRTMDYLSTSIIQSIDQFAMHQDVWDLFDGRRVQQTPFATSTRHPICPPRKKDYIYSELMDYNVNNSNKKDFEINYI